MANTYLTRTFGTPTNRKIWTWSAWVKRQNLVSNYANAMFGAYYDANNRSVIRFDTHELNFQDSANSVEIKTNRLFRDISAWYHIVARVDTTQGTASDRIRLYVNGEQQTSFKQADYPAQNDNMQFNGADPHYINGRNSSGSVDSIADMSYSHVHFIDGTAYDASAFGSVDSDTGEWSINTSPSVTYGNNGFFILKDGNTITDSSPNSNNFSLGGGTLTKTEDNPSNVFCTMNPLVNVPDIGFSEGNTKITNNNNGRHFTNYGTLGFSTGKYYWEAEASVPLSSKWTIGLSDVKNQSAYQQTTAASVIVGNTAASYVAGDAIGWYYSTLYKNGSTIASGLSTIASGDRMMIACDADNGKIYFGKNGTWRVANSTTFDAAQNDTTFTTGESYTPAFSNEYCGWKINFGNGYFGTTAVSSAGTNASNNGIFEYDVPTGYTALSTKGLNL